MPGLDFSTYQWLLSNLSGNLFTDSLILTFSKNYNRSNFLGFMICNEVDFRNYY